MIPVEGRDRNHLSTVGSEPFQVLLGPLPVIENLRHRRGYTTSSRQHVGIDVYGTLLIVGRSLTPLCFHKWLYTAAGSRSSTSYFHLSLTNLFCLTGIALQPGLHVVRHLCFVVTTIKRVAQYRLCTVVTADNDISSPFGIEGIKRRNSHFYWLHDETLRRPARLGWAVLQLFLQKSAGFIHSLQLCNLCCQDCHWQREQQY